MNNQEYKQKRSECWEEFKRENLDGEVQWQPVSRYDVFCAAFDRAYTLGKIDGTKEQKERDDHYIEMQKTFARFDKTCDRTIHALDKLTNTLDKL